MCQVGVMCVRAVYCLVGQCTVWMGGELVVGLYTVY